MKKLLNKLQSKKFQQELGMHSVDALKRWGLLPVECFLFVTATIMVSLASATQQAMAKLREFRLRRRVSSDNSIGDDIDISRQSVDDTVQGGPEVPLPDITGTGEDSTMRSSLNEGNGLSTQDPHSTSKLDCEGFYVSEDQPDTRA